MKICSLSLIIREIRIKTILRYYLTPVSIVIIKKSTKVNAEECVEKREHSCTVGGNVNLYSHYEKQYRVSLKN